jgi:hypothetical protein
MRLTVVSSRRQQNNIRLQAQARVAGLPGCASLGSSLPISIERHLDEGMFDLAVDMPRRAETGLNGDENKVEPLPVLGWRTHEMA